MAGAINGLLDRSENPQVAYPTPPIDRGVQRNRTMIEGQLKAIGTQRGPHTLAVNGNPLNLYTDDARAFRPAVCVWRRLQQRRSAQRRRPVAQARSIL